jgi:hypothetical protein
MTVKAFARKYYAVLGRRIILMLHFSIPFLLE